MVGKDEIGSFNLETFKFLMHFREPRSSLYFIFAHTRIFFSFLIHIFFPFFLFLFAPLEL
jgi:hypothetical protein